MTAVHEGKATAVPGMCPGGAEGVASEGAPGAGTLFGVGVGPGDPELLTLAAVRTLRACPVVAAPRTAGGAMLALDIARGALDLSDKEILPLDFTMSPREEVRRANHDELADAVARVLADGRDVAFVNLGDVSIYATYQHLAGRVAARGFRCAMVPGVPSFCAVAAALGQNLTPDLDVPFHVYPSGYADTAAALAEPGTKVLMKAGRALAETKEALRAAGAYGQASLVQDCGLPTERVAHSLDEVDDRPSYFSTMVVLP